MKAFHCYYNNAYHYNYRFCEKKFSTTRIGYNHNYLCSDLYLRNHQTSEF